MNPEVSVVIPTYNRASIMTETMSSLLDQCLDKHCFEIIVNDDGSNDETLYVISELKSKTRYHQIMHSQQNKLAGSGRNLGIQNTMRTIILMTEDDIIPNPNFLKNHSEDEVGVLGRVMIGSTNADLLDPDNRTM